MARQHFGAAGSIFAIFQYGSIVESFQSNLWSRPSCQVACGGLHTVALMLDGRLWSWGCNDDEVLGRAGEEDVPMQVGGALASAPVLMVSVGDNHSAALTR